jgi:EAL domain-containing protein (putative c-di-GMP-specific phosphodiesterase class I)
MMSVNVSNRQFWQSNLVDDIDDRLRSFDLSPDRLAIEITEGVLMDEVKLASSLLSSLKIIGVQVHIDDFGTGYSSLEALHDLSIDAFKIDRSFISRIATSPRSKELVRTIVTMGINLELDVIAEGIETNEELEFLRALGCSHGQGYLFSRPVPAEAFRKLLEWHRGSSGVSTQTRLPTRYCRSRAAFRTASRTRPTRPVAVRHFKRTETEPRKRLSASDNLTPRCWD